MGSVSENLKRCAVKITASVCGVPSRGSGIVYETPNYCDYNYVLTAKHILQEDSNTKYSQDKLSDICIHYDNNGELILLQKIQKKHFSKKLIIFDTDLVIIIIDKDINMNLQSIFVSDKISDNEEEFVSWGICKSNENEIQRFNFKRNDSGIKRIELTSEISHQNLEGISGAGVFIKGRSILYGIISRYPNEDCELKTIDCVRVEFESINEKLISIGRVCLDTLSSRHKREIKNIVVDIHQAVINGVCLDLELARKRLKTDIIDDWFHDPLKYIDLLNQDYLFKQFEKYFDSDVYKASKAEIFYIPKKKYALRQALVSPFIDRIMYMAVVGVFADKMDRAMIPTVFSARYNHHSKEQLIINGVEQWKKMRYALSEKAYSKNEFGDYIYNCVIEIDLLNYYDNISKKILTTKIERVCETKNEKKACKLLNDILVRLSEKDSGLPQNSDASSLLATFYLNQIDVFMHNKSFAYYRFMDDIRIFCRDKYEARRVLQEFECELRRCNLSINSQKTRIISIIDEPEVDKDSESQIKRSDLNVNCDLELSKISMLRRSNSFVYQNEAFHQSIKVLSENMVEDSNSNNESARKLNYALNTIELLCKNGFYVNAPDGPFKSALKSIVDKMKDTPWITTQVCKVLNLVQHDILKGDISQCLEEIVLNSNYNTYAFQTYQIWLLLAKHKIKSDNLISYAVTNIERNDETKRPVIAAMIVYVCSIDRNFQRVIIRKFGEGFTHGYLQNRVALISLRRFESNLISANHIDSSLSCAHEFVNKYKDKDLVYIQGFDESDENNNDVEQLYSL